MMKITYMLIHFWKIEDFSHYQKIARGSIDKNEQLCWWA